MLANTTVEYGEERKFKHYVYWGWSSGISVKNNVVIGLLLQVCYSNFEMENKHDGMSYLVFESFCVQWWCEGDIRYPSRSSSEAAIVYNPGFFHVGFRQQGNTRSSIMSHYSFSLTCALSSICCQCVEVGVLPASNYVWFSSKILNPRDRNKLCFAPCWRREAKGQLLQTMKVSSWSSKCQF